MKIWQFQISPMSHKSLEIKEGAFLISDAHYSHRREELFDFIKAIHSKKVIPTQLILMGDIFDALFGGIDYTCVANQEMIRLLNDISQEIELIYLEGNHDFNLKKLFPNAVIISMQEQPIQASLNDKTLYLAHGDFDGDIFYKLYSAFIRNPFVLFVLKYIDIISNHAIIKNLEAHLKKKDDCKHLDAFAAFIRRRLGGRFACDYFIEGHFHQNVSFSVDGYKYINLAAFACNQRYFIIKYENSNTVLEEQKFSKGK